MIGRDTIVLEAIEEIWRDVKKCEKMWRNDVKKCEDMSRNVKIFEDVVSCDEM